jgi:FKBP-type peptidyl-prolyl cis-trans isomerase FkpA
MVAPASEIQAVQNYLSSNGLTAVQHCSGLFYTIDNPGTGKNPDACSAVAVTYTGKLTNGTVFDQHGSAVNFSLDGLITAWRVGIPILKEGGRIHLYVPPTLGYGSQQNGTIPPNSILIFDITLVAVH